MLAWYTIDGLFTRKNSSLRPKYITTKDLSNHYVRAIETRELFPQRQQSMSESNTLTVLNMAYYPQERGPYNLDADNINPDGTLQNPEKRFGGMMRKIDRVTLRRRMSNISNFGCSIRSFMIVRQQGGICILIWVRYRKTY